MKPIEIQAAIWLIVSVIILSVILLSNLETIPETPVQKSAWDACITMASAQLKIPRIHADVYSPDSVTKLPEKEHYGVTIYSTDGYIYECDLARRIDGEWFLKSLYFRVGERGGKGYSPLPEL